MARLRALSARRADLESKLALYRKLSEALKPLKDPRDNIQPNLITRDGPLTEELVRCRALAARVAGRLADRQPDAYFEGEDSSDIDVQQEVEIESRGLSGQEKLDTLLDWS